MSLKIGDTSPDFEIDTTEGRIKFHDWVGDGWAVIFSHPKDFTPVCTTELGYMAGLKPEFEKRNCKVIGLSIGQSIIMKWAKISKLLPAMHRTIRSLAIASLKWLNYSACCPPTLAIVPKDAHRSTMQQYEACS